MNPRLLGIVCMAASALAAAGVLFFQVRFGAPPTDAISYVVVLLWPLGAMAGLTGLIQSNGVGSNPVVRAVAFLPVIGFGLTLVAVLSDATGFGSLFNFLTPVGFLVFIIGMVLVGIFTIAAKTWPGWRAYVPLIIIIVTVVGRATRVVDAENIFGQVMIMALWMVLGYVVATAREPSALERRALA